MAAAAHGSPARVMQYLVPGHLPADRPGGRPAPGSGPTPDGLRLRAAPARAGRAGRSSGSCRSWPSLGHPYRADQAEARGGSPASSGPRWAGGPRSPACGGTWTSPSGTRSGWGSPVMLCDQAIYSPSRRAGGPDWARVSRERPLRCVLGVAGGSDGPRVEAWLKAMGRPIRCCGRREVRELNTAEPGRRPVIERFEVFEFVPKDRRRPRRARIGIADDPESLTECRPLPPGPGWGTNNVEPASTRLPDQPVICDRGRTSDRSPVVAPPR